MGQSVEVFRFSMCNCLTVYWPGVYTAHAMTMDTFWKYAVPGGSLTMPYADLWPSGYVRTYRFPRQVRTFMFSPFNEAFHPSYILSSPNNSNSYRVTLGPHKGMVRLKGLAKPVPRLSVEGFEHDLRSMHEHAERIWKPKLKVLVLYDSTWAGNETRKRVRVYDEIARRVLKWPVIQIVNPDSSQKRWCHYDKKAHEVALAKLRALEAAAGVRA